MSRYLVVFEAVGQTGGRDDERERAAFEAALQRGYAKENRAGYSELVVHRFEKLADDPREEPLELVRGRDDELERAAKAAKR